MTRHNRDSRRASAHLRQYITSTGPIWTLLIIALLAASALWGPGMVNTRGGGDSPFLLQRTHQLAANLRAGVFPVRWMPDAAYGLGYPFFNHYSALPFYLAAIFNLIGFDILTAIKLTQTLGFLVAAMATYGWINHVWRNRIGAWLGAVAYTVAPFHLVNVYVRGDSLSEFYAFVFFPLILWALARLVEQIGNARTTVQENKIGYRAIVLVALAYAGLILSHNISAFIFSPFIFLFLILLAVGESRFSQSKTSAAVHPLQSARRKMIRPVAMGMAGLLLGMALAAWAWLPALLERHYVQSETLTTGYFDFANHFRGTNLIQTSPLFDYSIAITLGGPGPFAMSGLQAILAAAGFVALLYFAFGKRGWAWHKETTTSEHPSAASRSLFIFAVIGVLLSTFMITQSSRLLWEHIPLLATVQFPWRFLSVQSLFTSVATAALPLRWQGRRAGVFAGAIAIILSASALLSLQPERLLIGPADVTPTRLQEYELFTSNIGTTIRWEWLPTAVTPRPYTSDAVIEPHAARSIVPVTGTLLGATQTTRHPTEQLWRVQVGDNGATVAFPLLYWPGWRAWVDGQETPVWAVESSGYLALDLTGGAHQIHLKLDRTPLRARAELLSLIALIGSIVLMIRHLRPSRSHVRYSIGRIVHYTAPLCIILFFLISRSSPPSNRPDDLTMDFVAMPYLHHNPGGVLFADSLGNPQARLANYVLSDEILAPGDELRITLNWNSLPQPQPDIHVALRLVSPAEHLSDLRSGPYWFSEIASPLTNTMVLPLTMPRNAPRGVYLLQLKLETPSGELSARTPSGAHQGTLYLRPVRVTEGTSVAANATVLAEVGPDIRLHAAQLEQISSAPGSSRLAVQLEWSTMRNLTANYKISVRLVDPNGNPLVAVDTQPGYGFAPTGSWRSGERVTDRYNLTLPGDLDPGAGYQLQLVFYTAPTGPEVARTTLGPISLPLESRFVFEPRPRLFELPPLPNVVNASFSDAADFTSGDHIQLAGYDLNTDPDHLELTLWWVAQRQPGIDYTVFVHLYNLRDETDIAVQSDAMPRQGSYPTSGWMPGEAVSDTIRLPLGDVPPGIYRLAVGLYNAATSDRLIAIDPDGTLWPDGRFTLTLDIEVPAE